MSAKHLLPKNSACLFLLSNKQMGGGITEEKGFGDGDESLGSLEEQISVFFSGSSDGSDGSSLTDGDDEEEKYWDTAERAAFWEAQEGMIKKILHNSSLSGSKLRGVVNRAMKMERETTICHCQKRSSNWCGSCLRRMVVDHLHGVGYDAGLCVSHWRPTRNTPGGKHEYIDVVIRPKDEEEVRLVVELEFRAEFEMLKACDDYTKLVNQLPESYVGKFEHLNALVRIVCNAGKRSMNEKKIHLGPWRKRKFMQMKWAASNRQCSLYQSPAMLVRPRQSHTFSTILLYPKVKVS